MSFLAKGGDMVRSRFLELRGRFPVLLIDLKCRIFAIFFHIQLGLFGKMFVVRNAEFTRRPPLFEKTEIVHSIVQNKSAKVNGKTMFWILRSLFLPLKHQRENFVDFVEFGKIFFFKKKNGTTPSSRKYGKRQLVMESKSNR